MRNHKESEKSRYVDEQTSLTALCSTEKGEAWNDGIEFLDEATKGFRVLQSF